MDWYQIYMGRLRKIKRFRLGSWHLTKAKIFKIAALVAFFGVLAGLFLTIFLFVWYAKDLPRPDQVVRREGFATKLFDRKGEILYDVYSEEKRIPISAAEIPESLKKATVAIEDKNFYQHAGFDVRGWLRALFNIVFKHQLQGGSTLTQQLVKNVLLTSERRLSRKIKEFILAIQIERKYSKDQILQMYLNEAPYGGTLWGVESASETYFNKKTKDLNLVEAAFLAGLPQRPSVYSPFYGEAEAYKYRTKDVLRRMREEKYISEEDEKKALEELDKLSFASPSGSFKAPHFVMYIKQLLEDKYGSRAMEVGGLKVYTTLDLDLQEQAEKIVADEVAKVEEQHITNGAAMAIDPQSGEILAMVGSKDYFAKDYDGKYNVTTALRQPGSAIKPVTYVTAFKKGYTPSTVIVDAETDFPGGVGQKPYHPKNYTLKEYGPVQLRYALGNSLNITSVKLLAKTGVRDMLSTAYDMGLTTLEPTQENQSRFGLAVTLGGAEVRLLDLSNAYAVFANGGYKVEPVAILKIEDMDGKVLEETKPKKGKRVLDESLTFLINSILSDNSARELTFGSNSLLNISGRQVAVKTGTTDEKRDNWAIGWTPNYLVGVWVGNNDNSQMKQVASGVSGASPIWRKIVIYMTTKYKTTDFTKPNDVLEMEVDVVSGYKAHDGFASRQEYFIQGREPSENDPVHTKLKLCRGQEKLATEVQVIKGDYDEKEYIVLKEDDPISTDGKNRWQEAIEAWISKSSDPKYRYPKEYCDNTEKAFIRFNQPENEKTYSNELSVDLDAYALSGVHKIEFLVNDELRETLFNPPYSFKIVLPDGTYTFRADMTDNDSNHTSAETKIGINKPWNWAPEPTPTLIPTPTSVPLPSPTVTKSPTPIL
jgi:1A family penicillin-binding protein